MSRLGILVGPEVIRSGNVEGLQRFAAEHKCGVVNTWGAKGVFRWDSPFHFGSAGIQARDFELGLLHEVDVLVTSGLDEDEVTSTPWEGRAEVIDIAPDELFEKRDLALPPGTLEKPPLITELQTMVRSLLARDSTPRPAAQRVVEAGRQLTIGGFAIAEPTDLGLWAARTFPSFVPGGLIVPAKGGREAAWERAAAIAAQGHPATLLTDEAPPPQRVPGVEVDVWSPDDVDLDPTPLLEIAGPVVAW